MRRGIHVGVLFLALWPWGGAAGAAPGGIDAHAFWPAALDGDPRDPLAVQRPQAFSQGDLFAGVLGEFASDPLVQVLATAPGEPGQQAAALDNLMVLNPSIGVALHERARLDLALPVAVSSTHQKGPAALASSNGAALGDLRVSAMAVPVRPSGVVGGGGVGIGLVGSVSLPTGASSLFLGSGGVGGGGEVALTAELGPGTLGASVGGCFDPVIEGLPGATGGGRATFGVSAGVLTSEQAGLGLEVVGRPALRSASIGGAGMPVELLASGRYRTSIGGFLVVGGAVGLTDAVGVPAFRVFVGGGYGREKPPRLLDFDPIGPLKASDRCPLEIETPNGWRDDDGCPDHLGALLLDVRSGGRAVAATVRITGPDGTRTGPVGVGGLSIDALPGSQWSVTATEGCLTGEASVLAAETATPIRIDLLPRFDATIAIEAVGPDGLPIGGAVASWTSPTPECVPGAPVSSGETGRIQQGIGSGLPHVLQVSAPGYTTVDTPLTLPPGEERALRITLRPTKVKLEIHQIVILEKVQFDTGKTTIRSESFELLDEVASTVLGNPGLGRVEVAGHTDNQGSDAVNLKLSQGRAESVRRYLIGKGVVENILLAKGYGEAVPLDTNATAAGRVQNRRVEFLLIDHAPAGQGGTP